MKKRKTLRSIEQFIQEMPWAVEYVREVHPNGLLVCIHGRPLTLCIQCIEAVEIAYLEHKKKQLQKG